MSHDAQQSQALASFFASVAERKPHQSLVTGHARGKEVLWELLSFTLGEEQFALPLAQVQEVCRPAALTAIPRTSAETLGIMALRGTVVPVVHLAGVLGIDQAMKPYVSADRIILLHNAQGPLGLLVGPVYGVVRMPPQDISARPFGLSAQHSELIKGLGRTSKGMLTVLDGEALLHHFERLS